MTLEEVRAGIDAVDTQMKPLFLKRMECGKHVAEVKAQTRRRCICSQKRT